MRTPADEAKTRAQVEAIAAHGIDLSEWEQPFIDRNVEWIAASKAPFWSDRQAATIEQIWKARVK